MSGNTTAFAIDGDRGTVSIGDFSFEAGKLKEALERDNGETLPFTAEEAQEYLDVHASEEANKTAARIKRERRELEDKKQRDVTEQQRLEELTRLDDLRVAAEVDIAVMHQVIADAQEVDAGPTFKGLGLG